MTDRVLTTIRTAGPEQQEILAACALHYGSITFLSLLDSSLSLESINHSREIDQAFLNRKPETEPIIRVASSSAAGLLIRFEASPGRCIVSLGKLAQNGKGNVIGLWHLERTLTPDEAQVWYDDCLLDGYTFTD